MWFSLLEKKPGIMFHAVSLRVCKHMIIHVADFYALRFPAVEFYWLMFSLIKKKTIILFYSSLFAHRNPILRPKRSPGSHRQRETGARESWLVGEETGTYKSACFCSLMQTKSSVLWAYWIIFTFIHCLQTQMNISFVLHIKHKAANITLILLMNTVYMNDLIW